MIALFAAVALVLSACSPQQVDSFQRINYDRTDNGLVGLSINDTLMAKAQAWSDYLASMGTLRHSQLAESVDPGWWILGENVGFGPSIEAVEQAFMRSPGHRANILNPEFNWAGTGVTVSSNGTVFVVQVFAKY
ncbi:MAG TPA: CAP domain-containing protein [Acidimicrobiales bacterium]|nr:CAP domain-containing protein [Acidimicrobiales bacterium]